MPHFGAAASDFRRSDRYAGETVRFKNPGPATSTFSKTPIVSPEERASAAFAAISRGFA